MKICICILTWLAVTTPVTTFAGTFKDGPFIGYVHGDEVQDEGVALGWQAVYEVNKTLSLEVAASWQEDEDARFSTVQPEVPDVPIDLQLLGFSITGRIGTRASENVYLYTGGGVTYYEIDGDTDRVRIAEHENGGQPVAFFDVDFDKEWGSQFVFGSEIVLTPHWEIFAEYRQLFLQPNVQVRFSPNRATATGSQSNEYNYDHKMLRLGINYRF